MANFKSKRLVDGTIKISRYETPIFTWGVFNNPNFLYMKKLRESA